jgi:hypothetical protein
MEQETWIQIATGPVAALALCIFAIYFVARWLATNVPKWVDRHLTQIDTMIVSPQRRSQNICGYLTRDGPQLANIARRYPTGKG